MPIWRDRLMALIGLAVDSIKYMAKYQTFNGRWVPSIAVPTVTLNWALQAWQRNTPGWLPTRPAVNDRSAFRAHQAIGSAHALHANAAGFVSAVSFEEGDKLHTWKPACRVFESNRFQLFQRDL